MTRHEPDGYRDGEAALFAAYLDFCRETCIEKTASLPAPERTRSLLPSGWTPLGLLFHLACMERRWFFWGARGAPLDDPWEESAGDPDAPWQVPDGLDLDLVAARLRAEGARTTELLSVADLEQVAPPGPRFGAEDPPRLRWICFHVLQEYARHAGHLDVVVELAGGRTGE